MNRDVHNRQKACSEASKLHRQLLGDQLPFTSSNERNSHVLTNVMIGRALKHFFFSLFFNHPTTHREDQKLSQRETLWQQVESLARNNPEWSKMVGQFSNMELGVKRDVEFTIKRDDEFSQLPDNDLSYERLVQESGEVSNFFCCVFVWHFIFPQFFFCRLRSPFVR